MEPSAEPADSVILVVHSTPQVAVDPLLLAVIGARVRVESAAKVPTARIGAMLNDFMLLIFK